MEHRKLGSHRYMVTVILNPDGFVVILFDSFEGRAEFLKKLPFGELFANARPSEMDGFFLLAWKLDQLSVCQGFEL